MQSLDFKKIKSDFDQNGFVLCEDFISPQELEDLKANLKRFIEEIVPTLGSSDAFYEDSQDLSSLKQVFRMAHHDSFFHEMVNGSRFEKLAEILLGEKIAKAEVEYFNKPAGIGKPTPPHQDAYYFMITPPQALTFWIPLEDVDAANGCLHYLKGSHTKGMRLHGRTQTLGFSQGIVDYGTEEDLAVETAVPMKAGGVLAHHAMTVHSAPGNHSPNRARKVIGLVFFGESAQEDDEAKAAYREKLKAERAVAAQN